jgi:putative transposase
VPPAGSPLGARRWAVERTLAWLPRRRALLVRYDRHDENSLGLIQLAGGLFAYRRLYRLKAE